MTEVVRGLRRSPGAPGAVLVTNDDGPGADGLDLLVGAVAAWWPGPVVVATPATDVSNTGTAVGDFAGRWVRARPEPLGAGEADRVPPLRRYALDAYPSAIVSLAAAGGLGPAPAFVVAGLNHGSNTGSGLVHSSTVGAAMSAAAHAIPAVAFSAERVPPRSQWPRWRQAVLTILGALPAWWPAVGVLNVNLPRRLSADPRHVGWQPLAPHGMGVSRLHIEPDGGGAVERDRYPGRHGGLRLRMGYQDVEPAEADTVAPGDTAAVLRGEVSLSWLCHPSGERPGQDWKDALVASIRERWAAAAGPGEPVPTAAAEVTRG